MSPSQFANSELVPLPSFSSKLIHRASSSFRRFFRPFRDVSSSSNLESASDSVVGAHEEQASSSSSLSPNHPGPPPPSSSSSSSSTVSKPSLSSQLKVRSSYRRLYSLRLPPGSKDI